MTMTKKEEARQELRTLQCVCAALDNLLKDKEHELGCLEVSIVADEAGLEGMVTIHIGDWKCPTSPLGVCAYNDNEDPCHDDCLFCHEPAERK